MNIGIQLDLAAFKRAAIAMFLAMAMLAVMVTPDTSAIVPDAVSDAVSAVVPDSVESWLSIDAADAWPSVGRILSTVAVVGSVAVATAACLGGGCLATAFVMVGVATASYVVSSISDSRRGCSWYNTRWCGI